MEGELALIFLIASLTDMVRNHCPEAGCLAPEPAAVHLWLQPGATFLDNRRNGAEITAGFDFGRRFGPFQPAAAISLGENGEAWVGIGAHWRSNDEGWFADATLMPGLYARGNGPDLGHEIEFRASLGLGYAFDNGAEVVFVIDHRSNAELSEVNPGLETVSLRLSIPMD